MHTYVFFKEQTLRGNMSLVARNINKCRSDNAFKKFTGGCLFTYIAKEWKS